MKRKRYDLGLTASTVQQQLTSGLVSGTVPAPSDVSSIERRQQHLAATNVNAEHASCSSAGTATHFVIPSRSAHENYKIIFISSLHFQSYEQRMQVQAWCLCQVLSSQLDCAYHLCSACFTAQVASTQVSAIMQHAGFVEILYWSRSI